jgi:hypothetical protein
LQTTLLFKPVERTIAASYLQAIADHEGIPISATHAQSLEYATRISTRLNTLLDEPVPPGLNRLQEGSDLRAAISQLQAEVSIRETTDMCLRDKDGVDPFVEDPFENVDDFSTLADMMEFQSLADAYLAVSSKTMTEVS